MAKGGNVNEDDIERMAEAVMTLRRSGLFSVEPLDTEDLKEKLFSFPVDSDGPGDFVCTRRGRAYRKEPDNPKSDSLLGENPFKLPTDFDASRSVKTPLFPPTDRRGFDNAKLDQQLGGENLSKLPTGFCASPPKESPLISPAGFARVRASTPQSTLRDRFAPVFGHSPTQLQWKIKPERPQIDCYNEVRNTRPPSDPLVYARVPRISTFSGSTSKGEAGFEDWRFEVRCLMRDDAVHGDLLLKSVRSSLKGEASCVAMHLRENATLKDVLAKLERVYGTVESGTTLLQQFYNCRQEENETIGAYGCRLEDVLSKAIARGAVAEKQSDEMLRGKLWSGLKDERVRNATRYKLEQIHSFDELIGELRAAEKEIREFDGVRGHRARAQKVMYAPQTKCSDNEESTKKSIEELAQKVKSIEDAVSKQQNTSKILNKILDRIDALEKGNKSSNCRGLLSRDGQKSQHQNQQQQHQQQQPR